MPERILNVAVIGCGLIGCRRAKVAALHPHTKPAIVADLDANASEGLAKDLGCEHTTSWRKAVTAKGIDIVIVSTPNAYLEEIATFAMQQDRDVLIEKPMGRNLAEAQQMSKIVQSTGRKFKIGFNHRYHPAIRRAHELSENGEIGEIINVRGIYGHGGRPGYESEWRGSPKLAGGGELTDQGVHVLDLLNWFLGTPSEVVSFLQTAAWPIEPLEDNAFALLRYNNGAIAFFHTSWTQWKNSFSLHIHGTLGSLCVDGIGRSYGTETLVVNKRNLRGGAPETDRQCFEGEDDSWELEWADYVGNILEDKTYLGGPDEGVAVMRVLDALYRSSDRAEVVRDILKPAVFLDRDGVLNEVIYREGKPASPRTFAEFKWVDSAKESVQLLKEAGFLVLVVTNQPDIARKLMDRRELELMNKNVHDHLEIDDLYACTCDEGDECPCRKPKPGMLYTLGQRHGVDFSRSFIVGDSIKDIEAGEAAGVNTILINKEYNKGVDADLNVPNIEDAVNKILSFKE